jgi:hypothetical protein
VVRSTPQAMSARAHAEGFRDIAAEFFPEPLAF